MTTLPEDRSFTPVEKIGEFGLIERLTKDFKNYHSAVRKGVGDDAAVLDMGQGRCQLVSTDLLSEGVHFDLMYCPLRHLGYKAAIVNFSDIYAMNGRPYNLLVSIAFHNQFSVEMIEEIYAGIRAACAEHQVTLVGGDTAASRTGLQLSITVMGQADASKVVYRSGAQVHDLVCVTGDLGAAYAGLQILEREKAVFLQNKGVQPDLSEFEYVCQRQLKPEARQDIIRWLDANDVLPTSMIDVSDGLASEINHLCRAGKVGARIYQNKLPIDYQTGKVADAMGAMQTHYALYGGEDYELLFTIDQNDFPKLKDAKNITVIGHITPPEDGVNLVLADDSITELKPLGFNHFS